MKLITEYYRVPAGLVVPEKGQATEYYWKRYKRKFGFDTLHGTLQDWPAGSKGGKTVCRAILDDGTEYVAEAYCSFSDNFCYKRGRQIAMGRLKKQLKEAGFTMLPRYKIVEGTLVPINDGA